MSSRPYSLKNLVIPQSSLTSDIALEGAVVTTNTASGQLIDDWFLDHAENSDHPFEHGARVVNTTFDNYDIVGEGQPDDHRPVIHRLPRAVHPATCIFGHIEDLPDPTPGTLYLISESILKNLLLMKTAPGKRSLDDLVYPVAPAGFGENGYDRRTSFLIRATLLRLQVLALPFRHLNLAQKLQLRSLLCPPVFVPDLDGAPA